MTIPSDVPEHSPGHFSFAAFNRDYLAHHEGFSMMVLDTPDARADIQAWRAAGLQTYEPYDFSRMAKMPDGTDVKVGFSLAIVSHPFAPWLGLFACQHYRPDYFEQPQYMNHFNHASIVRDVWIAGDPAQELADFIGAITGAIGRRETADRSVFQTRTGAIVLASPRAFEEAFGVPVPSRSVPCARVIVNTPSYGSHYAPGVPTPPTEPFVGPVQNVMGDDLREDRHIKKPHPGSSRIAPGQCPYLLYCMNPLLAHFIHGDIEDRRVRL